MFLPWSTLVLVTAGTLTCDAIMQPTSCLAQQPTVQWVSFQLDNQLALQLPTLPQQIANADLLKLQVQMYLAQTPQAQWVVVRKELPPTGPLPEQDILYTGLAQVALTQWKAVGVQQAPFRVGDLTGLAMDFRVLKPQPGAPTHGTCWALRIKRTVYVVEYLAPQPPTVEEVAQKQHFLASWTLTQLPVGQPTPADLLALHVGQFRPVDSTGAGNTLIIRTDTAQTEINTALGLRIDYGLTWNQVGYDMTQRRSTSPQAALMQSKVIHVRITAVQGNSYWYRATIDDFITTGQIQRVK